MGREMTRFRHSQIASWLLADDEEESKQNTHEGRLISSTEKKRLRSAGNYRTFVYVPVRVVRRKMRMRPTSRRFVSFLGLDRCDGLEAFVFIR